MSIFDCNQYENGAYKNIHLDTQNTSTVEAKNNTGKHTDTVILLHGFPALKEEWHHVALALSHKYNIVVPNLKGYGNSSSSNKIGDYATHHLAKELHALITTISPEKPVYLVGHDWGGILAWYVESLYQNCIKKLITICAPNPATFSDILNNNDAQQIASSYMRLILSHRAEATFTSSNYKVLRNMFTDRLLRKHLIFEDDIEAYRENWSKNIASMLSYYRANFIYKDKKLSCKFEHESHFNGTETLVIYGEWDTAFIEDNFLETNEISNKINTIKYPETTHWLIEEKQDQLIEDINIFLEN